MPYRTPAGQQRRGWTRGELAQVVVSALLVAASLAGLVVVLR